MSAATKVKVYSEGCFDALDPVAECGGQVGLGSGHSDNIVLDVKTSRVRCGYALD